MCIIYSQQYVIQFTNKRIHWNRLNQKCQETTGPQCGSQHALLFAATTVSPRWRRVGREASGGTRELFLLPRQKSDFSGPLPPLTLFSSGHFREQSLFGHLKERRREEGDSVPSRFTRRKLITAHFQEVGRQGAGARRRPLGWRKGGAMRRVGWHLDPSH